MAVTLAAKGEEAVAAVTERAIKEGVAAAMDMALLAADSVRSDGRNPGSRCLRRNAHTPSQGRRHCTFRCSHSS